ncbi:hypothetical protein ABIQ69_14430 [Agromyces sp. G08B096]|uniref:Uncharacterized protein n=1 Tax=Agromyces sp. G08B096 TaxID=3156399 RepID=A0AAU7W5S3_9MICO
MTLRGDDELVDDELIDETVVVDRRPPGDGAEASVDDTVVVDRGASDRAASALEASDFEASADDTVVVDRSANDATVVVDRRRGGAEARPADGAGVGEHGGDAPGDGALHDPEDATLVVARRSPSAPTGAGATPDGADAADESAHAVTQVRRRRPAGRRAADQLRLDPIDLRRSVPGAGAGAVEFYRPRQLPAASPAPEVAPAGPPAARPADRVLPSVQRRSRRTAVLALGGLAAAVVVGLGGAVLAVSLLVAS